MNIDFMSRKEFMTERDRMYEQIDLVHQHLSQMNERINAIAQACDGFAGLFVDISNDIDTLEDHIDCGFRSSTTDPSVYVAFLGMIPNASQANIDYHWMRVRDSVWLSGRMVIPGHFEYQANTTGHLVFRLPIGCGTDTAFPELTEYRHTLHPDTAIRESCPKLIGMAWLTTLTEPRIRQVKVYGTPATHDMVEIWLDNAEAYRDSTMYFTIQYRISDIMYASVVTNGRIQDPQPM